jgi:hypothetical protein
MDFEEKQLKEEIEVKIDLEDAQQALADTQKNGTITWEEIKRELGL